jgi:hypothetical protein
VSRPRYRVAPVRALDGTPLAWSVFLKSGGGAKPLAVCYTGAFAWWRARFRAASLNRKAWQ